MTRHKQDKIVEICTSRKGLQNVYPKDFDIQNKAKKFRLQKLELIPLQGQLVLDAGCGPGTYGLILAQEGNEVVGIDISLDAIKVAKERARRKQVDSTFTPILADLENLPLRDNIFDVCFVGWTLHHFPSLRAVSGLARVLKNGGRIALTEPNELHLALKLSRHAENLFKGLLREVGLYTENAYVSAHTYKDYYKNLKEYGLTMSILTSCYAKEPVVIPRGIGFLKTMLLHLIFYLRHIFCTFITNISSSMNGTDLLILAVKNHKLE